MVRFGSCGRGRLSVVKTSKRAEAYPQCEQVITCLNWPVVLPPDVCELCIGSTVAVGMLDVGLLLDAIQVFAQATEEEAQKLLRIVLLIPRELPVVHRRDRPLELPRGEVPIPPTVPPDLADQEGEHVRNPALLSERVLGVDVVEILLREEVVLEDADEAVAAPCLALFAIRIVVDLVVRIVLLLELRARPDAVAQGDLHQHHLSIHRAGFEEGAHRREDGLAGPILGVRVVPKLHHRRVHVQPLRQPFHHIQHPVLLRDEHLVLRLPGLAIPITGGEAETERIELELERPRRASMSVRPVLDRVHRIARASRTMGDARLHHLPLDHGSAAVPALERSPSSRGNDLKLLAMRQSGLQPDVRLSLEKHAVLDHHGLLRGF
eukprot:scaffold2730_cov247-Pinguiococcus_pyrenoidosus.AAC.6